jgi:CheY-like chemotaxis protein
MLVQSHPGWEICAEVSTGREAVSAAKALKPDIAILAMSMPELNGLEAIKRIRTASPHTEILIRSVHSSPQIIQEALDAGARSYLLESDFDRDLVSAVETIANREPFPAPLTPEAVDSSSAVALVDPSDLEAMQRELAELIALVQQPLREQLVGMNEGKPDDPNARDYIVEELFAVAVRFCEMEGRFSERVAHLCCEIFSYLAPSRYDGLTPATMAQLMSNMAKRVPQRYDSEPQRSSSLAVDLLFHSDLALGTYHAERLRDYLSRFRRLLSKNHTTLPAKEESELHQLSAVLRIDHLTVQDAGRWTNEVPELHQMTDVLKITEELGGGDGALIPEEDDMPQILASHTEPAMLVPISQRIIDRAAIGLRTILREALGVLRTPRLLQNVKRWLNTPMK